MNFLAKHNYFLLEKSIEQGELMKQIRVINTFKIMSNESLNKNKLLF